MSINESALARVLRKRHGVVTSKQLAAAGITARGVRTLVSGGRLLRMGRGVFVSSSSPDTYERKLALACALTGGVVMYPTAGKVWQLRNTPRSDLIHVWVEHGRVIQSPAGVAVHRTTHLPAVDIVHRADGIRVTSPPRTSFDAAMLVDAPTLESLIEQGLDREWFTIPTLWAVGRRVGRRGRRGSGRYAAVLNGRPAWLKPVDSDHELRLERALLRRGFPQLVRQHPIKLAGSTVHPDLGIPDIGLFIEVDHVTWHGGRYTSAYDKRRDTRLRALGLHVERVPDVAIDGALEETVEDLWAIYCRRVAERSNLGS